MQFFTALLSALVLAASTTATPVHVADRSELIVVSPTILKPTAGTFWAIGSEQIVTWDTSNIPASGRNNKGTILLGYLNDGDESEHLFWNLGSGFLLTDGSYSITVPSVQPNDNYVLALLGDSGNLSPKITIGYGL
ncbi:hypothetical protein H4582DRAFT_2104521 [Lactarius indigo]|nr:hypothetical protein H4582DRAFT_2104521 [Lactarius indigo]